MTGRFRDGTASLYEEAFAKHGATPAALLSPPELHALRLKRAAAMVGALVPPGSTLLDLGCGYGALRPLVKPSVTYVGMDSNESMLAAARGRYPETLFVHAEFPPPPGECEGWDYVVALGVACHLEPGRENLRWFASQLQRVAWRGMFVEFQSVERGYVGKLSSFSTDDVTYAFSQRPSVDHVLSDGEDSTVTVFFRL